eukprot:298342-Prorocentrum_minimum.AAC.1
MIDPPAPAPLLAPNLLPPSSPLLNPCQTPTNSLRSPYRTPSYPLQAPSVSTRGAARVPDRTLPPRLERQRCPGGGDPPWFAVLAPF